jgi:hypothetical protein
VLYCQVLMKSPNKILVKILHSVPVLSSLTVSQLQRLADVLTEVTVAQRSVGPCGRPSARRRCNPTQSNEMEVCGESPSLSVRRPGYSDGYSSVR